MTLFDSTEIRAALRRYLIGKYQGDAQWFREEGEALSLKGLLAVIREHHPNEVGAVARMVISNLAVADPRERERRDAIRRAYRDFNIGYGWDLPNGAPGAHTLDDYLPLEKHPDTGRAKDAVMAWLGKTAPPILVLAGPPGTGKSHLADAAGQALLQRGDEALYRLEADIFAELRPFAASNRADAYATVPWLIIDEMGVNTAEWVKPIQDQLINARWVGAQGGLRTLATLNLKAQDLPPRVASRLADAALSRAVTIAAPDYRRHRRGQCATTPSRPQKTG